MLCCVAVAIFSRKFSSFLSLNFAACFVWANMDVSMMVGMDLAGTHAHSCSLAVWVCECMFMRVCQCTIRFKKHTCLPSCSTDCHYIFIHHFPLACNDTLKQDKQWTSEWKEKWRREKQQANSRNSIRMAVAQLNTNSFCQYSHMLQE